MGITGKSLNDLEIPENLDLTHLQQINRLKLCYKLAGVVAHHGDGGDEDENELPGHYIATVRGQGSMPFQCIDDGDLRPVSLDEFLENPQDWQGAASVDSKGVIDLGGCEIVQLTYLRMATTLDRELRGLGIPTDQVYTITWDEIIALR
ncbi:hypothetical protein P280DRAFT_507519 [Massarina eburnea CBS 473.64]|uniref:Peptidase C19 ubiquitin carboxyl-terminal hydrolase domain-containing protein n=1 Tax=Massarina eburnea CBS 473.64 TaxID=1395130 RepID=A0A6A6S0U2_9PLEO|nr:hypothetical protein P280DRAFT_507519 [Massarina eburnea CBS 473.64]